MEASCSTSSHPSFSSSMTFTLTSSFLYSFLPLQFFFIFVNQGTSRSPKFFTSCLCIFHLHFHQFLENSVLTSFFVTLTSIRCPLGRLLLSEHRLRSIIQLIKDLVFIFVFSTNCIRCLCLAPDSAQFFHFFHNTSFAIKLLLKKGICALYWSFTALTACLYVLHNCCALKWTSRCLDSHFVE